MRTQIVEFLADLYQIHTTEHVHQAFAEADLYNTLLFYFEYHPYHNILHQRVTQIFTLGLDRNHDDVINHLLYQTSLIRRILDTSKLLYVGNNDGGFHTFTGTSGHCVARGFLVFIRKLANKLVEMQKANEEISSFLESIPEWAEYSDKEL